MFALDSNALSYAMREEGGVADRLRQLGPSAIAIPTLVVFEVNFGLLRVGRLGLIKQFAAMVNAAILLDFDLEAADHAARIRVHLESKGMPIGPVDLLIAATARRHRCTLVTRNTRDFARVPDLAITDWY